MKTKLLLLLALPLALVMSNTAKAELKVGDGAPDITATTDTGDTIKFSDVYAKKPYTLVFFYPKADTPGCTAQNCSLRDGWDALTAKGVTIVGVSHDTVDSQKAFKGKYNLPFTLVADPDDKVIGSFGVHTYPFGLAHRSAYLIKDGKIIYADYKGTTKTQAQAILDFLATQKA